MGRFINPYGGGGGGADILTQIINGTKTTIEPEDDFSFITNKNCKYRLTYITTLTSVNNSFFESCTNLDNTFSFCTGLLSFIAKIGAVSTMYSCFQNCTNLAYVELDLSLTNGGVNVARGLFATDPKLTEIKINGMYEDAIMWGQSNQFCFFGYATNLIDLTFTSEITANLYLYYNTKLNFASILNVLTQTKDYSSGTAHTITMNITIADVGGQLASAVAAANAKNWTVSGLTLT